MCPEDEEPEGKCAWMSAAETDVLGMVWRLLIYSLELNRNMK